MSQVCNSKVHGKAFLDVTESAEKIKAYCLIKAVGLDFGAITGH